jgi:L-cystine uptake protein TcyP (sodium:dicarboxylate symporter family)
MSLEVRVALLFVVAISAFVGVFVALSSDTTATDRMRDHARAECADYGGLLTPVAGRVGSEVYGCVFPPSIP